MSGPNTNTDSFHEVRVVYPALYLLSRNAAVWMPIPYSAHLGYPQDMPNPLLPHREQELTSYIVRARLPYEAKSKLRKPRFHYLRNDSNEDESIADDMFRVTHYEGETSLEAVAFVGTRDVNIHNILDSVVIRLRRHTLFPGSEFEERIYELNMKEWYEAACYAPSHREFWWSRLRNLVWRVSGEHYCIVQRLLNEAGFVEPRVQWGPPAVHADRFLQSLQPVDIQSLSENQKVCVICQEDFVPSGEKPTQLSCGHILGLDCLGTLLRTNGQGSCPSCRRVLLGTVRDLLVDDMTPDELHRYLGIAGIWTEQHADNCIEHAMEQDPSLLGHWSIPPIAHSGWRDYNYIKTFELLGLGAEFINNRHRFVRDQWTRPMDDYYLRICREREGEDPVVPAPNHYAATVSFGGLSQEAPLGHRALYYKVLLRQQEVHDRGMGPQSVLQSDAEVEEVEGQLQAQGFFTPADDSTLDEDSDDDMDEDSDDGMDEDSDDDMDEDSDDDMDEDSDDDMADLE